MSRALILMATARFKGSPLTPEETERCLQAWRDLAGGLRVYVPTKSSTLALHSDEILNLRMQGKTLEEIGKAFGVTHEAIRLVLQELGTETCNAPCQPEITETG